MKKIDKLKLQRRISQYLLEQIDIPASALLYTCEELLRCCYPYRRNMNRAKKSDKNSKQKKYSKEKNVWYLQTHRIATSNILEYSRQRRPHNFLQIFRKTHLLFSPEFAKIFRTPTFRNNFERLHLKPYLLLTLSKFQKTSPLLVSLNFRSRGLWVCHEIGAL